MSQQAATQLISLKSTNDYNTAASQKKYYIMKVDTANDHSFVIAAAATDPICGILQDTPRAGEAGTIAISGTAKVIAGGTVTRGDDVTSDSSGKAVTTTTNKDRKVGTALVSAVSGDIFEIQLCPGFPKQAT